MNIRACFLPVLLGLLAVAHAWSRVVVDDSAPEPPPEKTGQVHVPAPKAATDEKPQAPPQDSITFLNKDQLHGILLGIDGAGLRWQTPAAQAPIDFGKSMVAQIKLDSHKAGNGAKAAHRIGLTNGDEFPGNIVSMDDKTLVLETWYAGRLSFPRAMLRRITPVADANAAIYEGPKSLDEWTVGRMGRGHNWSFRDGALIGSSYGMIGRDVQLPDMSEISFDAALRGNNNFSVGIYSDRADDIGSCYLLQLSNNYTELQRYSRNGGTTPLGSAQMQNILRRDKSHVVLRTNKEKKSIWLMIDDKLVKEWTDPSDFNGGGGNIVFSCPPGSIIRISNIKVSKWDGKFDDASNEADKTADDCVELVNEDKVTGRLASIQDGKAKFESAYAELNIPLDRISQISMAGVHAEQPKQDASDVRAYFPDGGSVTMQLIQWDAKGCIGSSPNFGKATFSPDAFAKLSFNLSAQQQNAGTDEFGLESDSADGEGEQ